MIEGLKETLALPMKSGERDVLPSPTELMRKVLIKGKRGDIVVEDDEEEDEEFDEEEEIKKYKFAADKGTQQSAQSKKKAIKTHPDLAAITYLGTGKVKSFKPDVSKAIPCDMMCSYSEVKVNKHVKNSKTVCEWIDHNKAHLRYEFIVLI